MTNFITFKSKNKYLIFPFGILFLFLFSKSFYISGFDAYGIGDMLINYKCGFVRRGVLGTFFIEISSCTGFNILKIIEWVTFLFYLIVFGYIFLRLKEQPILLLFVILSPIGYFFVLNHWLAFAKKDVYILLLFICSLNTYKIQKEWLRIILLYSIIILGVLIHENFLFFSLPYVFLYQELKFTKKENTFVLKIISSIKSLAPLILITGFLTLLIFLFSSKKDLNQKASCLNIQYEMILKKNGMPDSSRVWARYAVGWLKSDLKRGIQETSINYLDSHYRDSAFIDVLFLLLSMIWFIYLSTGSFIFLNKFSLFPITSIFLISGSIFISYIAIDWGRWMHLIFMHLVVFVAYNHQDDRSKIKYQYSKKIIFLTILILIIGLLNIVPVYYREDSMILKSFGSRFVDKVTQHLE